VFIPYEKFVEIVFRTHFVVQIVIVESGLVDVLFNVGHAEGFKWRLHFLRLQGFPVEIFEPGVIFELLDAVGPEPLVGFAHQ